MESWSTADIVAVFVILMWGALAIALPPRRRPPRFDIGDRVVIRPGAIRDRAGRALMEPRAGEVVTVETAGGRNHRYAVLVDGWRELGPHWFDERDLTAEEAA